MSAELERLAAEFEQFQSKIRQAERTFGGVGEMQERIAGLEAVATSADRSVRVVAGPAGAVKDIQLTPEAMRLPSTTLAETIMTTLRAAVAEAVRRQAGIVEDTFGGAVGASTLEQVHHAQALAAGTPAEDLPSEPGEPDAVPRRPARSIDRDLGEDFGEQSIFDR